MTWKVLSHTQDGINIKLDFSEPGEISSSSLGRDELKIELLDIKLFKSMVTGESMQYDQFEGMPEISFKMPPIVSDMGTIENL